MNITDGVDVSVEIKEHIQFGDFDSRDYEMRLMSRNAPTPSKREIIESLPFTHGNYDFSRVLGEDFYNNRPITYVFHLHENEYNVRKVKQTSFENELMKLGITQLRDSYSEGYYYLGKVTSVNTDDDHVHNRLIVTIAFDCYPFKISDFLEGNDIWDTFNFELDVAQVTEFQISGSEEILLINNGGTSIAPKVITDAPFSITKGNVTYQFGVGETITDNFRLDIGENNLIVEGNGHIEFSFRKELI